MNQAPDSSFTRIAALGGVYSNHIALEAAVRDARERGAEQIFCLGDLGAFGPSPDKVFPILEQYDVKVMRGNYDDSIARGLADCQCGYTDPRDNYFAALSYDYTFTHTSIAHRTWLGELPNEFRFRLGGLDVLCCHGSPRQINEFLWESATPTHFLRKLVQDFRCDILLGTHTGVHWQRRLGPQSWYVNVGAVGRPANDGRSEVWYTMLNATDSELRIEFVKLRYDYELLANEMRDETLPDEFIETIRTGWWTTCLEVLPAKERSRGKF